MSDQDQIVVHVSAESATEGRNKPTQSGEAKSSETGLLENILDAGVFDAVLAHFDHRTLIKLLIVCRGWLLLIDPCESVWRSACQYLWADKVYVPKSIRALIQDGNDPVSRTDLQSLSAADLKKRLRHSGLTLYQLAPFQNATKKTLLELVMSREAPRYPGEPLAERALRLSLEDANRHFLTEDELTSFEWHVRVRSSGPFNQLTPLDPWWAGGGQGGRATFTVEQHTTKEIKFVWPPGRDPFDLFNMRRDLKFLWDLDFGGKIVQLSLGQWGPRQTVARHPVTWGFVLVDPATLWTSWPMPPRGEDVLLEDEFVNQLVQHNLDELEPDSDSSDE